MTDRDTDPDLGLEPDAIDRALDRDFLAWVRNPATLDADLRAKYHETALSADCPLWRLVAIERELARRGKDLLPVPVHVLQPKETEMSTIPAPPVKPLVSPLARAALENGVAFDDVAAYAQYDARKQTERIGRLVDRLYSGDDWEFLTDGGGE